MREILWDLESDGLLKEATVIHSLVLKDRASGSVLSCGTGYGCAPIKEGLEALADKANLVIGHNIINFDVPLIRKLHPEIIIDQPRVFDTLVASRVIWPNIVDQDMAKIRKQNTSLPMKLAGSHTLEAWGHRTANWKGDYSLIKKAEWEACGGDPKDTVGLMRFTWGAWSQEMQSYCEQDVVATEALYNLVVSKAYPQQALDLEHYVAWVMQRMMERGFFFAEGMAYSLLEVLQVDRAALNDVLTEAFPPKVEKIPFTPKANNSKLGYIKGIPTFKTKTTVFNPNSRQQVAERLMETYGWKPTVFTPSGQPQIDETTLKTLDFPEVKLLSRYMMLQKRIGQIGEGKEAWLNHYDKTTGAIHGRIISNGAVTGRATHSSPNLGQVPSVEVEYGKDCRKLFCARPGYKVLGCDVSGLELRMLAHFMWEYDDGAYAEIVVNGDVHTVNQAAAGLPSRALAKRFIYAFLYGAGDELIGELVNGGKAEGKKIKKTFYEGLPALKALIEATQGKVSSWVPMRGFPPKDPKTGQIDWRTYKKMPPKGHPEMDPVWHIKGISKDGLRGLDGRHLHSRSEHSALNLLLQSAGAIVCKQWIVEFDKLLIERGLHNQVHIVAWVHDELQMEVPEDLVREDGSSIVGDLCIEAIVRAGKALGIKVPLTGEYKIGNNWAETH